MQLVNFSVSNYRSITKAQVTVSNSTILIGPNNEGKSNILLALVTALQIISQRSSIPIIRKGPKMSERFQPSVEMGWEVNYPIHLQKKHHSGKSIFRLEFALADSEVGAFRKEVRSNLNGTLPIEITIGKEEGPRFKVKKQGRGGKTLSKKAREIAQFLGNRIDFVYIPSVRIAQSAKGVIQDRIRRKLSLIEGTEDHKKALDEIDKKIGDLYRPVLEELSGAITKNLKTFLPDIQRVQIKPNRYARSSFQIIVDDGTPTPLERKGGGVQSLAAISLLQSQHSLNYDQNLILAIEEPESHLHPNAIHRLRSIIAGIAESHQVILTTHCPIFADRYNLGSNVIVSKRKAKAAKSVAQIRDILGVKASDNLTHAELVLVVEGSSDSVALRGILSHESASLKKAINDNILVIESLRGASKLSYRLSQLRDSLCNFHCFLDNDEEGKKAEKKAREEGLLEIVDIHFASCPRMPNSELEDMYEVSLYSEMILSNFGVSVTGGSRIAKNKKWSDRMRATFERGGKPWDDNISKKIKAEVAKLAYENPGNALHPNKRKAFDKLLKELESKLKKVSK